MSVLMAINYVKDNLENIKENPYVIKLLTRMIQDAYIEGYRKAETDYEKQIMNYREKKNDGKD